MHRPRAPNIELRYSGAAGLLLLLLRIDRDIGTNHRSPTTSRCHLFALPAPKRSSLPSPTPIPPNTINSK